MKFQVAKVPASESAAQLSHVGRILDFAGAPDRRIACNATVPASIAARLEDRYTRAKDWTRTLAGRFSSAAMLHDLALERVLTLYAKTQTVRFSFGPESSRPLQDWDGEWRNLFRISVTADAKDPVFSALDQFALEWKLKLFSSEVHESEGVFAMRGFQALSSVQMKEVWAAFLQSGILPPTMTGEVCYVGEIASLPGLGGASSFEHDAEMQADLVFGEVAKQLAALNQNLAWAQGFYTALSAATDGHPFAFSVERQYLNWKTSAGETVRGSSGNAVRLRAGARTCELTVEFEQYANSDPKASELKAGFLRFWSEAQKAPLRGA